MPADITVSSQSIEYIQVPVQAILAGVPYDPTGDVVDFAFTPLGSTTYPSSWTAGSWSATPQGSYLAQCLIGTATGGVLLTPGIYTVWVKITDSPEVPVKPAGTMQIT